MDQEQLAPSATIEGVQIHPLKQMMDERGAVLHMLRNNSPLFVRFGEIYFSEVLGGAVKAWKRHTQMTQKFAVPVGRIRLVIHDDRLKSPSCGCTTEIHLGRPDNYQLVQIPPMVWYGFQGIGNTPSLLANCADLPHDPKESEVVSPSASSIPFHWGDS